MKIGRNILLLGLVLSIFLAINAFSVFGTTIDFLYVNSSATGAEYVNNTEHNTATPSIFVNLTGNSSYWNCTIRNITGGALLSSASLNSVNVTNGTQKEITFDTLTTGFHNWTTTCFNLSACANDCVAGNSSHYRSEINMQPTISSTSIAEIGYRSRGSVITFTGTWTDSNSSGTDDATLYVCKDSGLTAGTGCSGTTMCSNGDVTTNTTSCTYTIASTETAGIKTYYSYVDDNNAYTSLVLTGNWYVGGSFTDEQEEEERILAAQRQTQTTTTTTTSKVSNQISQVASEITPIGWIVIIGLVAVILYMVFIRRKK